MAEKPTPALQKGGRQWRKNPPRPSRREGARGQKGHERMSFGSPRITFPARISLPVGRLGWVLKLLPPSLREGWGGYEGF